MKYDKPYFVKQAADTQAQIYGGLAECFLALSKSKEVPIRRVIEWSRLSSIAQRSQLAYERMAMTRRFTVRDDERDLGLTLSPWYEEIVRGVLSPRRVLLG